MFSTQTYLNVEGMKSKTDKISRFLILCYAAWEFPCAFK